MQEHDRTESPQIPFKWIVCEEVVAPLGSRRQVALDLWLIIFVAIQQKVAGSASGVAEVAHMVRQQDILFEESEAVRPPKKKKISLNYQQIII